MPKPILTSQFRFGSAFKSGCITLMIIALLVGLTFGFASVSLIAVLAAISFSVVAWLLILYVKNLLMVTRTTYYFYEDHFEAHPFMGKPLIANYNEIEYAGRHRAQVGNATNYFGLHQSSHRMVVLYIKLRDYEGDLVLSNDTYDEDNLQEITNLIRTKMPQN